MSRIPNYAKDREVIPREGLEGHDKKPYHPDPKLITAINAAIILGRPLLLTGEPGCGKTDFAHAVANHCKVALSESQVRSDSRARDLLYHYDALHRFGDAHHTHDAMRDRSADPRNYIELRPLGNTLIAPTRQVALIDEIDKAPRDLPNDLLFEIERGEFDIPELRDADVDSQVKTCWGQPLRRSMKRPADAIRPIIIITSNVERQLPEPFLRRCVFYNIRFPEPERLREIVRAHVDGFPHVEQAVTLFRALREQPRLSKKPGTSELVDWAKELCWLYEAVDVAEILRDFAAALEGTRLRNKAWTDLPGLHSLLKLREDVAQVSPRS